MYYNASKIRDQKSENVVLHNRMYSNIIIALMKRKKRHFKNANSNEKFTNSKVLILIFSFYER